MTNFKVHIFCIVMAMHLYFIIILCASLLSSKETDMKKKKVKILTILLTLVFLLPKEFHFLGPNAIIWHARWMVYIWYQFKLVLLTVGQANKLRYDLLWQGTVTLFGKPADWGGGLVSQRTIFPEVEVRLLLYWKGKR